MSNIKKLQDALVGSELDALLLWSPVNRQYATGFHSSDGGVIISRDRVFFFTDSRYIEAAGAAVVGAQLRQVDGEHPLRLRIKEAVEELGARRLGAEERRLSHALWTELAEYLPAELVPAENIMTGLRASKSPAELEAMIAAQRIAERALDDVLGMLRPGLTENEVAAELTYRMLKYGGAGNSFDPIVVTGPRSSMPHGVPGKTPIQRGDFVTMDFGTIYGGYCSDMTRTVAVGSASDDMKTIYSVVLEAQLAGIAAAKPGVPGCDVHKAAAAVIRAAGYGEYFGHGFGHSLGLEIHESPNASPSEKKPLPEGAVISAEPGIYLPGRFGVRIEDVLYLDGEGCINITKAPKELLIV